jgi:cytosine/adenosine deaminase-related metal-dependent hydrolase
MAADFAAFDLGGANLAGALHDPVAALVLCAPEHAASVVIDGRVVVEQGRLTTIDLGRVLERHNRLARQLIAG